MADIIPAICLGTKGWTTDLSGKFDILLAQFFISDYNQTYLYRGYVSSLPRIIQESGSNVAGVVSELNQKLRDYFGRYYASVDVKVSIEPQTDPNDVKNMSLRLSIGVNEAGQSQTFERIVDSKNGRMNNILTLNN